MNDPMTQLPHYKLKYRNAEGKVREHDISQPFDSVLNKGERVGFVAYSYGRGIRSFRNDRVIEMSPTV